MGIRRGLINMEGFMSDIQKVPYNQRLCISVEEAAEYSMIGENRLRRIIEDDPTIDWVLRVGSRMRIKRQKFEKWVLSQFNI